MSAEVIVVLPVIMLAVLACMQVCLLYFGRSVALAAAQAGVRAARADEASRTAGGEIARRYAERTAGEFLHAITATSTADQTTVQVTVHGRALSLVPFLPSIAVSEQAAGPIERFTTPDRSAR
ncbi:pilus assembly protein [Spongiactinospora rosea]|uniref:Pilus assembly protein n=1 Tax=Spongiactinospora rosea TaxID=2248750 RepID=A0A366M4L3_9ACTN|nr:TadE/TadG family type IV pilus assembly protein [Spongiactinospora rosea]RBQ21188.1 pilus assembly protein [Spongiactinospora rosea]